MTAPLASQAAVTRRWDQIEALSDRFDALLIASMKVDATIELIADAIAAHELLFTAWLAMEHANLLTDPASVRDVVTLRDNARQQLADRLVAVTAALANVSIDEARAGVANALDHANRRRLN